MRDGVIRSLQGLKETVTSFVTVPAVPSDKASWRAWARARRTGLVIDHAHVVDGLRAFLATVGDGWVLTYRPAAGEIDVDALLADHRCAVTRTLPAGQLTVHPADAPTEPHRFGYLQPVAGAPEVALGDIAVALVPGLAFDVWGTRLGHGQGHYDRLLPLLPAGVARVGVTPAAHVVAERLPAEAHDVVMTHLATERGVHPVQT
jgi:5-formyltetrahydrofolate cyclo-ligase